MKVVIKMVLMVVVLTSLGQVSFGKAKAFSLNMTDSDCVSECMSEGKPYSYCSKICSW